MTILMFNFDVQQGSGKEAVASFPAWGVLIYENLGNKKTLKPFDLRVMGCIVIFNYVPSTLLGPEPGQGQ